METDDSVHSPVGSDPEILTSGVESLTLLSDPLTDQLTSLNDLTYDLAAIEDLAARGSWRSILENVARARAQSHLHKPHDHLVYVSFNVLALSKLRRFTEALAELNSLGDLDSDQYRYETYPNVYMGRTGSMLPFTLRWLNAIIPIKLNQRQEGLDRLYGLLDFVQLKLKEKEVKILDASVNLWKKRKVFVLNCIVGYHLSNKEFAVCLSLIKDLLNHDSSDPVLISKLGYIQLQVGDIEGAESLFDQVKGLRKEGESIGSMSEIQHKNLVNRNKALIYIVGKDFSSAVREYDQCIERDHTDVVAINNKALCLMYLRDLSDSIKVLESALERVPTIALSETLVVNLCSMYELAYVNHSDIKRTLSSWIARVAPDDFDSSCTRT